MTVFSLSRVRPKYTVLVTCTKGVVLSLRYHLLCTISHGKLSFSPRVPISHSRDASHYVTRRRSHTQHLGWTIICTNNSSDTNTRVSEIAESDCFEILPLKNCEAADKNFQLRRRLFDVVCFVVSKQLLLLCCIFALLRDRRGPTKEKDCTE